MRKIVVGMFISLDGVVESPGPDSSLEIAGWTMPYWDNAIGEAIGASNAASDAMLLGRVTFQGFEQAFAGAPADNPDAAMLTNIHKYVVSNTLTSVSWKNSSIISGDVIGEIRKLKEQPGKDIVISGSITLVHSLMQHDLIDEYLLILYPLILGMGRRLFDVGASNKFKLTSSKKTDTDVMLLTYSRDRGD